MAAAEQIALQKAIDAYRAKFREKFPNERPRIAGEPMRAACLAFMDSMQDDHPELIDG